MRIVFVTPEYPPNPHGGIGTFVQTLGHEMASAGHNVVIAEVGTKDGCRAEQSLEIVSFAKGRLPIVRVALGRLRLYRWLRDRASRGLIDIIEVPEFAGLLPVAITNAAVVVRLHQSHTAIASSNSGPRTSALRLLELRTLRAHRHWMSVSQHALSLTKAVFGVDPITSATVYPPISEPLGTPRIESYPERFVLYAGVVCERKGAYLLAEAAKTFLAEHRDVILAYAGAILSDGSAPADSQIRRILGPDFAARVRFLGQLHRSTLFAWMERATVFTLPSRIETFGLVLAEAMLAGTPVVSLDTPPFNEFILHNRTGLLTEPGNVQQLGAAICSLLGSPCCARRIAVAAQQSIRERFAPSRCAAETIAFYQNRIAYRNEHAA